MMTVPGMKVTSLLRSALLILILDQSPTRARTLGLWTKKCTHGGYPLECPFGHILPT